MFTKIFGLRTSSWTSAISVFASIFAIFAGNTLKLSQVQTFAIANSYHLVDRPTQLICISEIYLSTDKFTRDIARQSASHHHVSGKNLMFKTLTLDCALWTVDYNTVLNYY